MDEETEGRLKRSKLHPLGGGKGKTETSGLVVANLQKRLTLDTRCCDGNLGMNSMSIELLNNRRDYVRERQFESPMGRCSTDIQ